MRTLKDVRLLVLIICTFLSNSCQKDIETEPMNADFTFDVAMEFESQLEALPNGSKIVFDKLIINDNYRHMYQKSSGITCGSSACLAVSYMMGRQILKSGENFSTNEVNNLRNRMQTACGGIYIDNAARVAKEDFGTCQSNKFKVKSTSSNAANDAGRTQTKDEIQKYLTSNKPLIARVDVKSNGSISETAAYTHFIVIVGLTLTDVGTGSTIYYIDPLKKYAEILDCSYTKFLNSMKVANNYYYLLPLGCL